MMATSPLMVLADRVYGLGDLPLERGEEELRSLIGEVPKQKMLVMIERMGEALGHRAAYIAASDDYMEYVRQGMEPDELMTSYWCQSWEATGEYKQVAQDLIQLLRRLKVLPTGISSLASQN